MKKILFANLLVLVAFGVKATRDFSQAEQTSFEKNINHSAKQAVQITQLQQELDYQSRIAIKFERNFEKMAKTSANLASANQQAINLIQKLRVDNDNLVKELERKGLITPELAKQIKRYDGRIPASDSTKK